MNKKGFFIASTGQHVGKTTTSLGLVSGLKKRFAKVGFMKPIGQEHVEVEANLHVDKDIILFKDHFHLEDSYADMSPVLFPRGFTRDYLDGKIDEKELESKIIRSYETIANDNDVVIVEGTGHVGVGTIVNLDNAKVASLLGLEMILIASGGLGSSFDALALNLAMCEKHNIKVAGIILNRVLDDKRDMVIKYMTMALEKWNIPILGCIPFDHFLSNPSMRDFESLFSATLLTGEEHHLRHFRRIRLVATSVETYAKLILPSQLIITPSMREDIIYATLDKHWESKSDLCSGMILTGDSPPRQEIVEELKKANIPMIYTPLHSYNVMKMITSYTVKLRTEDREKIQEAISIVKHHMNFDKLCSLLNHS